MAASGILRCFPFGTVSYLIHPCNCARGLDNCSFDGLPLQFKCNKHFEHILRQWPLKRSALAVVISKALLECSLVSVTRTLQTKPGGSLKGGANCADVLARFTNLSSLVHVPSNADSGQEEFGCPLHCYFASVCCLASVW